MDDQRCTGRTTRLILRALYELLELPDGTPRELVFVVAPGMRDGVRLRIIGALASMLPEMELSQRGVDGVQMRFGVYGRQNLELAVRVASIGTDLRGTCPTVICIDHEAERLLDLMPRDAGWARIPMGCPGVKVRYMGMDTYAVAIDPRQSPA